MFQLAHEGGVINLADNVELIKPKLSGQVLKSCTFCICNHADYPKTAVLPQCRRGSDCPDHSIGALIWIDNADRRDGHLAVVTVRQRLDLSAFKAKGSDRDWSRARIFEPGQIKL